MTSDPTSNRIADDIRASFSGKGWPSYAPDAPALLNIAAREIDRLQSVLDDAQAELRKRPESAGSCSSVETKAPHSGFCAVVRGGRCDCGTDALNGVAPKPPFEPIIQCDTTTARIQRLIEMDAVPSYVVRALLHERDSWRENYWMRMEQIAAAGSAEETKPEPVCMTPVACTCHVTWPCPVHDPASKASASVQHKPDCKKEAARIDGMDRWYMLDCDCSQNGKTEL